MFHTLIQNLFNTDSTVLHIDIMNKKYINVQKRMTHLRHIICMCLAHLLLVLMLCNRIRCVQVDGACLVDNVFSQWKLYIWCRFKWIELIWHMSCGNSSTALQITKWMKSIHTLNNIYTRRTQRHTYQLCNTCTCRYRVKLNRFKRISRIVLFVCLFVWFFVWKNSYLAVSFCLLSPTLYVCVCVRLWDLLHEIFGSKWNSLQLLLKKMLIKPHEK